MPESNIDDLKIITSVLNGSADEYEKIVLKYQASVRRFCLGMLRDETLSDDAAQEVFLKAYQALQSLKPEAALLTWLLRIARNHCIDLLRAKKRTAASSFDELSELQSKELVSPSTRASQEARYESKELLLQLLQSLPENYRTIIVLRDVQDLSYEEIAKVLDCSLDSVKAQLRRARAQLRERMRHFSGQKNVLSDKETNNETLR